MTSTNLGQLRNSRWGLGILSIFHFPSEEQTPKALSGFGICSVRCGQAAQLVLPFGSPAHSVAVGILPE